MNIKIILLLSFLIVSIASGATPAAADPGPRAAYGKANGYYEAGEWDNAVMEYEGIIESGYRSGPLFYNLGNCYLKKGDTGRAILNYYRAYSITPRDSDLLFNLEYARSLMKQQDMPEIRDPVSGYIMNVSGGFTLRENVFFAAGIYYLIVLLVILGLFFRILRPYIIFLVILAVICLMAQPLPILFKYNEIERGAVVLDDITDARFEPSKDAEVHFPLYEGMKVYVLGSRSGWQKVKRPDGKIGWIERDSLEQIRL